MKKFLTAILVVVFSITFFTVDTKTAEEILERSNNAMGGDSIWAPVQFVKSEVIQSSQGMDMEMTVIEDRKNSKVYMTTNMPMLGELTLGYDGENTWMVSAFHKGYLNENDQLAQLLSESSESYIKIKSGEKKFTRLDDEIVDGIDCYVLQSSIKDNTGEELPEIYYFDKNTYYLIRKETIGFKLMGLTINMVEKYYDYEDMEGKIVPFVTVVEGGIISSVSTITDIEFNPYVSDSLFKFEEERLSNEKDETDGEYTYQQKRMDSFELIWNKIKDYHWNPDFDVLWWEEIKKEFLPLVESAESQDAFISLMNKMVSSIGESHTVIIPKKAEDVELGITQLDIDVRWLNDEPVIIDFKNVESGKGGIQNGDIILEIDGVKVSEIVEADYSGPIYKPEFKNEITVKNSLYTKDDEELELKIERNGEELTENVKYVSSFDKAEENPYEANFRYGEINGKIGYIAFDMFMGDIVPVFEEAINSLYEKDAIIIDLRGNHGGQVAIMMSMANFLLENPTSLGEFVFRNSTNSFDIEGNGDNAYKGRIIFLTDSQSASCAEIFPQGMHDIGRAEIIGQPSSGLALLSSMDTLPTGDTFQYVIANYMSPAGITVEGKGVIPDIEFYPTGEDWQNSEDPILDFAVDYILK